MCIQPQLVLLERVAVMQSHYQRGVKLIEESREAIVHLHRHILHDVRPLLPIVAGNDEQTALRSSADDQQLGDAMRQER